MGREIRMVPANWDHPWDGHYYDGTKKYQPMFDQTFESAVAEWKAEEAKWLDGSHEDLPKYFEGKVVPSYSDWAGECPDDPAYYRPWKDGEGIWFQVWQTVSEGSPVTPPFEKKEDLIEWLVTKGESYGTRHAKTWSREAAENFVNGDGWAPSLIVNNGVVKPGYEAVAEMKKPG